MTHRRARAHKHAATRIAGDVTHEEIEKRAYQRYCDRGCAPGGEVDDWLAAERELLEQRQHREDSRTTK